MALEPDIISILTPFGFTTEGLFITLLLGFSILFTFSFSSKRKNNWKNFGEIDKLFLSYILALALYVYFYAVLSIYAAYKSLFSNSFFTFGEINAGVIVTSIFFIAAVWSHYFLYKFKIKKKTLNFLEFMITFLSLISLAMIIISIGAIISNIFYISIALILYSFGFFCFSFLPLYIVSRKMKNRKVEGDYGISRFLSTRKISNGKLIKMIVMVIIISFALSVVLFPRINKIEENNKGYYLDAKNSNGYEISHNIENFALYKNLDSKYEIYRFGFLGWLPIDYYNLETNMSIYYSGFKISLVNDTNQIVLSDVSDYLKSVGILDYRNDKVNKKIIIYFNNTIKNFSYVNLSGFVRSRDLSNVSINESIAFEVNKTVILFLNVSNELDRKITILNLGLDLYNSRREYLNNCNLTKSFYKIIQLGNESYIKMNEVTCDFDRCGMGSKFYGDTSFYADFYRESVYFKSEELILDSSFSARINMTFVC